MERVLITRKDLALLQARACEVLEKSVARVGRRRGRASQFVARDPVLVAVKEESSPTVL